MTDHERYLIERLTVEVAKLRETIEELNGNGRGPLAPHLCVSQNALKQLRQIAERLKERADEVQSAEGGVRSEDGRRAEDVAPCQRTDARRGEGNDAELAPRAQDKGGDE